MRHRSARGLRGSRLAASLSLLALTAAAQNPIVLENQLPGTDPSTWYVAHPGDANIQGFATDISVDVGETVRFKIDTDATAYHIDVYRLGWYQGLGARLVGAGVVTATLPQLQPAPLFDAATALTDCGNWAESAHWDVPASAVSGIYLAKLIRDDATPGTSHVIFVVRDDASTSDILVQTSDSTWQAYNLYGGASLYPAGGAAPGYNHALKASYNRPFDIRHADGSPGDDVFAAEYAMVRFLERNGYDVSYTSSVDSDRRGALIQQHALFVSVGHDEYWSGAQRAHVTAARDAGTHLAFFSGNEVYWKIRYEPSIDGSGTPHRTLVCYKEGSLGENGCGTGCDPSPEWTGLWRDGCPPTYVGTDACDPESTLTGQYSWDGTIGALQVPASYKDLRFWRHTGVAALGPGQTATLGQETLGSEWDIEQPGAPYPARRLKLSQTQLGGRTHHLSLYRADSGALVFGAGTIQWSWGLDDFHTFAQVPTDVDMQQATVNLLADMGIAPATLMAGLTAATGSSDTAAPASMITQPLDGQSFPQNGTIVVQGVAADTGGGVVAGVEVSTDGGATWTAASGAAAWTFAFTPIAPGPVTILSRAFDDTINLEPAGTSGSPNVIALLITAPVCPCSVFGPADGPVTGVANDGQAIELGMRFRVDAPGDVTALRYYKAPGTTGVHTGSLWTNGGALLAQATFVGETASGWQEVALPTPVAVTPGVTYVVSYHSASGDYAATLDAFVADLGGSPVRGLADGLDGPNGVFLYTGAPAFPTGTFRSANYWADVVFDDAPADTTPPTVLTRAPAPAATVVPVSSAVRVTFDEPIDPATLSAATFELRDPLSTPVAGAITYEAAPHRATFTPAVPLDAGAVYTVTLRGGGVGPSIRDVAGNALAADDSWSFTTAAATAGPFQVFPPTDPLVPLANDGQPLELGVKFRALVAGHVTALRYYKPAGATGTRTGNLWTAAGANLAQAAFANETASGWQEVALVPPVPVAAGTTYVASYFSSSGDYAGTPNSFGQEVGNNLVRALADGADGPNGVFLYTPTSAFPNQGAASSNYWVDVVFHAAVADATAPTVLTQSPAPGAVDVVRTTTVTASFDEAMDPSSLSAATFELRDSGGALVPATVAFTAATDTVELAPAAALLPAEVYTATLRGGAAPPRVRDAAGNPLAADVAWSFTTAALPACPCTVFAPGQAPTEPLSNDGQPIEVGTKFRVDVDGLVTALRFYKPVGATGPFFGSLWTGQGALLAQQQFAVETAQGWQEVLLTTPVPVVAGATYVVSYFGPGDYVSTLDFFTQEVGAGLVHGLADGQDGPNGVFAYAALPTFPTGSFRSSNYWVDVVFHRGDEARTEFYGQGCAGTGGQVPVLSALGLPPLPQQPNPTFGLHLGNALPQTFAVIAAGAVQRIDGTCTVLIDGIGPTWFVATSALGEASVPLPIPTTPSFLGQALHVQAGVFDAAAVTSVVPGLALTRAMRLTIGVP
ncbi:MAG: DUF4082 domain-containing protein [Planctomycetota bacterium]